MLKYYKIEKETGKEVEITYEKALSICLGVYKDNDMTRDMLSIVNRIDCNYSLIEVRKKEFADMDIVLMAGLYNTLPIDAEYDEDGNRICD